MKISRKNEGLQLYKIEEIEKGLPELKFGDIIELTYANSTDNTHGFLTVIYTDAPIGNKVYLTDLETGVTYQTTRKEPLANASWFASSEARFISGKVYHHSEITLK